MLSHKPTGQPASKLTVLQAQAHHSGIAVIAVCINKMDSHTAFYLSLFTDCLQYSKFIECRADLPCRWEPNNRRGGISRCLSQRAKADSKIVTSLLIRWGDLVVLCTGEKSTYHSGVPVRCNERKQKNETSESLVYINHRLVSVAKHLSFRRHRVPNGHTNYSSGCTGCVCCCCCWWVNQNSKSYAKAPTVTSYLHIEDFSNIQEKTQKK